MNDDYYQMIIPLVRQSLESFEPNDLVSVIFSSTKLGLKKRELKRNMLDLTLEAMALISRGIKQLEPQTDEPSQLLLKQLRENYFELYKMSKKFIVKEEHKQ